jgi:tetratricopeptide (TPR) repeat protein
MLRGKAAALEKDWVAALGHLSGLAEGDLKAVLLNASVLTGADASVADGLLPAGDAASLLATQEASIETASLASPSTTPNAFRVFEVLLAVQSQFVRGLCVEKGGNAYAALSEFIVVTACYRESPFARLWRSPAFAPFIGFSVYRYGLLCSHLATDRLLELPAGGNGEALKGKLLLDAAVALRMYLAMDPGAGLGSGGRVRRAVVLKRYGEVLEGCFQRANHRVVFSSDQYLRPDAGNEAVFCPEDVQEDLILCSMLKESLFPGLPESRAEAQTGATILRQRQCLRRLARAQATGLLVEFLESLIERFAANAQIYGQLVLSLLSEGDVQRAYVIGDLYCQVGGHDPAVLAAFCELSLRLGHPDKVRRSTGILEGLLEGRPRPADDPDDVVDMRPRAAALLGRCYLRLADGTPAYAEKAVRLLEEQAQADPFMPDLRLVLCAAHLLLGRLDDAEQAVKAALLLDKSRAEAWHLLALLRSARRDHLGALEICNIQLDNQAEPSLPFCLLKTDLLAHFGEEEEAVELLKSAFHYWLVFRPRHASGPSAAAEDPWELHGEPRSAEYFDLNAPPPPSAPGDTTTTSSIVPGTPMGPAKFRARFLRPSATGDKECPLPFAAVAERFPAGPAQVKASLLGLDRMRPDLFTPAELIVVDNMSTPAIEKTLWLQLGRLYLKAGLLGEAELAAQQAYALDQLDPGVYHLLGRVAESSALMAKAVGLWEKGLAVEPRHLECLLALGRRYLHGQNHALALACAKGAMEVGPRDHRTHALLADVLQATGNPAEAGLHFRRAISLHAVTPVAPFPLP